MTIAAPTNAPNSRFADPSSLGFGALGLTLFVLSLSNTGLVPAAGAVVLSLALVYGGVVQLLAGVAAFVTGNTFTATAFVTFGAFWLSFWWLETNPAVARQAGFTGIGIYLLVWAIFSAYMLIAALTINRATLVVFAGLLLTFLALSLGALTGAGWLSQAGGWLGLAASAAAAYVSAAAIINATWGRIVLPLGTATVQSGGSQ